MHSYLLALCLRQTKIVLRTFAVSQFRLANAISVGALRALFALCDVGWFFSSCSPIYIVVRSNGTIIAQIVSAQEFSFWTVSCNGTRTL